MSKSRREQLLDHLSGVDGADLALPSGLQADLTADPVLESWWARRSQQVRALRRLRRLAVPLDLAGRVVAATQGGYRQERAVEHLGTLEARRAPLELLGSVRGGMEFPAQGADGRYLAPDGLGERVASELQGMGRPEGELGSGSRSSSRRPAVWLTAALLVAGLLSLNALLQVGEVLAGDTEVARGSLPSFDDITAFECIQLAPGSPQADDLLRGLDAFAGGAHEGSRR